MTRERGFVLLAVLLVLALLAVVVTELAFSARLEASMVRSYRDGVLEISRTTGLQSITDLNGNRLTYSAAGITHSSGLGVAFTRDGLGRITAITDPDLNVMSYGYDANGNRLAYSLEPQLPFDGIDPLQAMAWDFAKGELTLAIAAPDGTVTHVGTRPFVGRSGLGPTTKDSRFTAWKPTAYGLHTVTATGFVQDLSGRRYEAGGTYRFWIAKRMTMATATFQGMAYPVGTKYGRDIAFSPAVPADVTVTATLYPGSDAAKARSITYSGKATAAGVFGAAQGMQAFPLDAPGEYHAAILAKYTDADGHLWVCAMRHAGVVYPEDSPVVAHGKKVLCDGKPLERGETKKEGWVDDAGESHLQHVTFPWNSGDVLLIAAEGEGANKIEPVMTYEVKGEEKAQGEVEIRRSKDVFRSYRDAKRDFPGRARILSAKFSVQFSDAKRPRTVTIRPSNIATLP